MKKVIALVMTIGLLSLCFSQKIPRNANADGFPEIRPQELELPIE